MTKMLNEFESLIKTISAIPKETSPAMAIEGFRLLQRAAALPIHYEPEIIKAITSQFGQHPADGASYRSALREIRSAATAEKKTVKKQTQAIDGILDSDLANSERMIRYFGEDLRYSPESGWMHWNGAVWRSGAEPIALEFAKDTARMVLEEAKGAKGDKKEMLLNWARKSQGAQHLKSIVSLCASDDRIRTELSSCDGDPWLFNCQNGMINLINGQLLEHSREKLCTRISPASYEKDSSEAPLWCAFLNDITAGDKKLRGYLQRVAGYCLTGSISEKCFFFCYGSGDNGKSVFIEVIHALLGDYCLALSTQTLVKKRFGNTNVPNDIARLCGPRLATVSETSKGEEWDDALIKDITGGDKLTARFLRKEFFDFRPQAKLMIRGNNKPQVTDSSAGMWRRLQLIPFEVQIPEEKQDKELRQKIINRELSGVLMWALEGCLEWQRIGLAPPDSISDAVQEYRLQMDTIGSFLDECTVPDPTGTLSVGATDIYEKYKKWADISGHRQLSQTAFGMELAERKLKKVRNKFGWRYINLSLNEELINEDSSDYNV